MTACTEEQDFDQIYLSRSSYAFDAAGGSVVIEVTSNATWSAEKKAEWLTLSPAEDRMSVTVTAAPQYDRQAAHGGRDLHGRRS